MFLQKKVDEAVSASVRTIVVHDVFERRCPFFELSRRQREAVTLSARKNAPAPVPRPHFVMGVREVIRSDDSFCLRLRSFLALGGPMKTSPSNPHAGLSTLGQSGSPKHLVDLRDAWHETERDTGYAARRTSGARGSNRIRRRKMRRAKLSRGASIRPPMGVSSVPVHRGGDAIVPSPQTPLVAEDEGLCGEETMACRVAGSKRPFVDGFQAPGDSCQWALKTGQ